MHGPFFLNKNSIEKNVSPKPGAYYLTYIENNKEVAYCVGRSNDNLKVHLLNLLPEEGILDDEEERKEFYKLYVDYVPTAKAAYELECQWYHKYAINASDVHPAKTHPTWICPVCGK